MEPGESPLLRRIKDSDNIMEDDTMSVNRVSNTAPAYDSTAAKAAQNQAAQKEQAKAPDNGAAAVYEKGDQAAASGKLYTRDTVTIDRLKSEAERRTQSMLDLVQKLMTKQGKTVNSASDIYAALRTGQVQVDDATRLQAQKDIAEDGYWGIEKTSDRILEFAKALSGGDTSKADELIGAVKKGFNQAAKAWGGDLPDISQKTIDAAIKKMEAWRDGTEGK